MYCVLLLLCEGASVCLLIDCVELWREIQSSLKRQLECWPSEELDKQAMDVSFFASIHNECGMEVGAELTE